MESQAESNEGQDASAGGWLAPGGPAQAGRTGTRPQVAPHTVLTLPHSREKMGRKRV